MKTSMEAIQEMSGAREFSNVSFFALSFCLPHSCPICIPVTIAKLHLNKKPQMKELLKSK